MFSLFSDIFTYRDNVLSRLDVRAKLGVALAALLAVILSTRPWLPLALLAICLTSVFGLRIPAKLVAVRLAGPMAVAAAIVVLQSLTSGVTPLAVVHMAQWHLAFTREGLAHGLVLGSRVLGAVSIVLLVGFVTPAHEIFRSLAGWRLCRGWLEVATLMYRYVFVLMERAAELGAAQRLRLGYSSTKRSLDSASVLAGATILSSYDQAVRTHEAMLLRGYTGEMPFGPARSMSKRDGLLAALALLALVTAYVVLEVA